MKRLIPIGMLVAAAVAVPAYATSTHANSHANTSTHGHNKCKHNTLHKSYVFGGTLTADPTVTQTAGQGTATKRDDRYDVTLSFTVTHANKYAKGDHPNGSTFSDTLSNVRVSFGSNTDGSQRTPVTGDSVNVKGTQAFKVKHNCQADPNDPVGGVKYVKVSFGDQPQPQP